MARDRVAGDVYHLGGRAAWLLASLDVDEGGAFVRRRVTIARADGRGQRAWIHVMGHERAGRARIASGDFLAWADRSGSVNA